MRLNKISDKCSSQLWTILRWRTKPCVERESDDGSGSVPSVRHLPGGYLDVRPIYALQRTLLIKVETIFFNYLYQGYHPLVVTSRGTPPSGLKVIMRDFCASVLRQSCQPMAA